MAALEEKEVFDPAKGQSKQCAHEAVEPQLTEEAVVRGDPGHTQSRALQRSGRTVDLKSEPGRGLSPAACQMGTLGRAPGRLVPRFPRL